MRCSNILSHLEQTHKCVGDGIILGDSGYACKSFLMTPYPRPIRDCQEKFNRAHIRTRSGIERCFGWWKKRFNCLHAEIRTEPERVCKIIMACAVLHNIAVEMKEPMDDVDRTDDLNNDINIAFQGPDEGPHCHDVFFIIFKCSKVHV